VRKVYQPGVTGLALDGQAGALALVLIELKVSRNPEAVIISSEHT
jgi:hypothetical protein